MYCVFHHISDHLQRLILFCQFKKKVGIRSDPRPPGWDKIPSLSKEINFWLPLVYDVNKGMWTREAKVSEIRPSGRSNWVIECSTGRWLLRSRRHLRRMKGRQQECVEALKKTATREQNTSQSSHFLQDTSNTGHSLPCSSSSQRPTSPKSVRFALGTKRS